MSDVFISYARSTEAQAKRIDEALRALGHEVWRDDQIAAHQAFGKVLEERLAAARAVLVLWSADASESEWVRSEASRARTMGKLAQLRLDATPLPMPFDQIQCADLSGWNGEPEHPGWRKVIDSVADLTGAPRGEAWAAHARGPAAPTLPSIAVLPFTDMTGAGGQDYFVDGMMEEITTALSRVRSIFVIASASGLSFKGSGATPQQAARQLGVRYALEGSVRRSANRVRIAVKLIDGADGAQLWADRFDDTLDDVFALQDRVAHSVAAQIEPNVRQAEMRRASGRPTTSMSSYDLYLRAYPLVRTYQREAVFEALDLTERAIAIDPDHGAALGVAAECHTFIFIYGWSDDPEDHRRRGAEMSRRALKAAGDDAQVIAAAVAPTAYLERDLGSAITLLERATSLNPGCAYAWQNLGSVRLACGQVEAGLSALETSARLDPMGPDRTMRTILIGWGHFQQGRFAEAATLFRAVAQETAAPSPWAMLVSVYGHLGDRAAAREAAAELQALTPQSAEAFGRAISLDPAVLQLFLDGLALAESGG